MVIKNGDTNEIIKDLIKEIPNNKGKVLSFCVVDICALNNLKFETIKQLTDKFVDFLVLIPSFMDANRNLCKYIKETNTTIDNFLGDNNWRNDWKAQNLKDNEFGIYVVKKFGQQMKNRGYHDCLIENTVLIRSDENNLPLYHLAFYSRSSLGVKFWKQAKKYANPQTNIFD